MRTLRTRTRRTYPSRSAGSFYHRAVRQIRLANGERSAINRDLRLAFAACKYLTVYRKCNATKRDQKHLFSSKCAITSCMRAAATVCPRPSPPPVSAEAPSAAEQTQRSSSFPRPTRSHAHRCSRLTRQYGGEQSGLHGDLDL